MLFFWTFLLINEYILKKNIKQHTIVFKIDNYKKRFLSSKTAYYDFW